MSHERYFCISTNDRFPEGNSVHSTNPHVMLPSDLSFDMWRFPEMVGPVQSSIEANTNRVFFGNKKWLIIGPVIYDIYIIYM